MFDYPEHVWQVAVQPRSLGSSKGLTGEHHICLTYKSIALVRVGDCQKKIEFPLNSIRRCGHTGSFFFLGLGRSAATGAGDIWMLTEDAVIAENMHSIIRKPLWPECVLQRDFEGFEELEEEAVVHEIVSLGNSMGLEVDDDDVEELVEEHSKELSTEELLELHKEENETLKWSLTSEESGEDEGKEESRIIPAKDLKDAFFCWSKLCKLAEDYHPDVGSVEKAISVFNDNVMNYFWKLN
ncbi:Insulin receptor substrate 2-like [Homarus americanus]|uniref:Insulin receptor substrate 2-like n=1 Tax=Homarus americanus TaxID=6706 RepID=A0A8J5T8N9_HOMAM|nr:Insulin receptor substrate 2-like [Homarus americanus]